MNPTPLEALYMTRSTLRREPFAFAFWGQCTCGHIYRAATDAQLTAAVARGDRVRDPHGLAVIEAVARTLGWGGGSNPFSYISEATRQLGDRGHVRYHNAALAIVEKAIAELEAQQETDRLAVLAQLEAIVDAPEEVPAVTDMLKPLEALQRARRLLLDESNPYHHGRWQNCTVGYVHWGATGRVAAADYDVITPADPAFRAAIMVAARALTREVLAPDEAVVALSLDTRRRAGGPFDFVPSNEVPRSAALATLEDAIHAMTQHHEEVPA